MKREPWQQQCPEVSIGKEQCEREKGHEGGHESENCMWGEVRREWWRMDDDDL